MLMHIKSRHSGATAMDGGSIRCLVVMPTKVGIQEAHGNHWIPDFAGMTKNNAGDCLERR